MEQASQATDGWKFHPVYHVGIGFGIGVCFAMTWLAPAQIGLLKYEVEDARRAMATHQESKDTIAALRVELEVARRLAREAQNANLFRSGSPYPIGFGKVKVGDPITNVEQIYTNEKVNKDDDSYWRIEPAGMAVRSLVYYFQPNTKEKRITHISIGIGELITPGGDELILSQLQEVLGPPEANPKKGFYTWRLPTGEGIFLSPPGGYLIMREGFVPGWWPGERPPKK